MKKFSAILLFIFLSQNALAADGVVLLRGTNSFQKISDRLEQEGFLVLNLDPTPQLRIEESSENIHSQISQFSQNVEKIHFIGHSLGGLVARSYIRQHRPENLGKSILLATPNRSSEAADFFSNNFFTKYFFRKFYSPAQIQMMTDQNNLQNFFGKVDYELYVIAGEQHMNPFRSFLIGKPNDGVISIDSTQIKGMRSHSIFTVTHETILSDDEVIAEIVNLLKK